MKHIKLYEDFSGDEWLPNGLTLTLINPHVDEFDFLLPITRVRSKDDLFSLYDNYGYFYVIQHAINNNILVGQIFPDDEDEDDNDGMTVGKPKLLFASKYVDATYPEIVDTEDSKEMILDAVATYGDKLNDFLEVIKTQYKAYYPGDAEIQRVKNSDYSRMSKAELEELLDQAVEEGDYKKADEINRHLNPDSFKEN
jgi:hypothetical protein